MSGTNCFLVGGPMDGKTYVLEHVLQELKFEKPGPVRIGGMTATEAIRCQPDVYVLAGHDLKVDAAVYVHDPMMFWKPAALLHAAKCRHQERQLLHSALGALRQGGSKTFVDNIDLIRAIEETLK